VYSTIPETRQIKVAALLHQSPDVAQLRLPWVVSVPREVSIWSIYAGMDVHLKLSRVAFECFKGTVAKFLITFNRTHLEHFLGLIDLKFEYSLEHFRIFVLLRTGKKCYIVS
jgi:hypothetical protein